MGFIYSTIFAEKHETRQIKVITLNYCDIMNSPYEFYCKDFEKELGEISKTYVGLLPKYFADFDVSKFSWKCGQTDKAIRKSRYSPVFNPEVGVVNGKFLTRAQFEQKWDEVFDKLISNEFKSLKFSFESRSDLRTYDTVAYHTLLCCFAKVKEIDEAANKSTQNYLKQVNRFFQLSFLDEERKLKKLINSLDHMNADVLFFQQYSPSFLKYAEQTQQYYINHDPRNDTLILAKKTSFNKCLPAQEILKNMSEEERKLLNWSGRSSFLMVDDILLLGAHLSSKEIENHGQIQNLMEGLAKFKELCPKNHIILGGDLNSFLKPFEGYEMYPSNIEPPTTIKKRTMMQAQYKKGEKLIVDSKDKIISNLPISNGKISLITGEDVKNGLVPSDDHPFDHFLVSATVTI